MALKGKHTVVQGGPLSKTKIINVARYRARTLPAPGALLKEEDKGVEQISLL